MTCAKGERVRKRECNSPPGKNGGSECEGDVVEKKVCDLDPCPGRWFGGSCLVVWCFDGGFGGS